MRTTVPFTARQFHTESVRAWYWRGDGLSLPYSE